MSNYTWMNDLVCGFIIDTLNLYYLIKKEKTLNPKLDQEELQEIKK